MLPAMNARYPMLAANLHIMPIPRGMNIIAYIKPTFHGTLLENSAHTPKPITGSPTNTMLKMASNSSITLIPVRGPSGRLPCPDRGRRLRHGQCLQWFRRFPECRGRRSFPWSYSFSLVMRGIGLTIATITSTVKADITDKLTIVLALPVVDKLNIPLLGGKNIVLKYYFESFFDPPPLTKSGNHTS